MKKLLLLVLLPALVFGQNRLKDKAPVSAPVAGDKLYLDGTDGVRALDPAYFTADATTKANAAQAAAAAAAATDATTKANAAQSAAIATAAGDATTKASAAQAAAIAAAATDATTKANGAQATAIATAATDATTKANAAQAAAISTASGDATTKANAAQAAAIAAAATDATTKANAAQAAAIAAAATDATTKANAAQAAAISAAAADATTKANAAQAAAVQRANHSGTQPLSSLSQSGATSGQVPKWNGTGWVPADDIGGGSGPVWLSSDPGATTIYAYWNDTNNRMEWLSASSLKAALAIDQVNNTSDADKPVSTAQQTALDLKAGLAADNDFTGKNSFTDYSRVAPAALATGTQTAAIGKHYTTTLTANLTVSALSGTLAADAKIVFELRGCNGTAVFDFTGFGTAKRNGATNVTSTSITPTAGNHTFAFLYDLASTTWYYSDTVASPVNLAGGAPSVTGVLPTANGGYAAESARDDVGAALTDSNTIDFTLNDGADTITADAKQQMSITSDASGLKLSGDASTPGNTKYYGTNGAGTKGWYGLPVEFLVAIGDETTALTTGTAKVTFRAPYALTLAEIRTALTTASSSGLPTINIKENGTTIFSTKPTIDASEKTSTTAVTASVLSDTAIADDSEITIDVDVAGTGAAGLKVLFKGSR